MLQRHISKGGIAVFEVLQQTQDKHVVIPDLHGEHEMAERVIDAYIDFPDVNFVFLGDVLDRRGIATDSEKGVFRTLEHIRKLGERAVMVIANHEWYPLAAMFSREGVYKETAIETWLGLESRRSPEFNTLLSYDLDKTDDNVTEQFKSALMKAGHLAVLTQAMPYFETDTFIAVHAGVDPFIDWATQKDDLRDIARDMAHGVFYDNPEQWFSMDLAVDTRPILGTTKTVVSGHAHHLQNNLKDNRLSFKTSRHRSLYGGKRVRLASQLNAPRTQPLYVWQDWDGEIIKFDQDEQS